MAGKTWIRALAVVLAFLAAIGGAFVFGYRATRDARHIHESHEPVRPWMSIPWVAHTHHVPESVLFDAIGIHPRGPHDRRSIRRLARELNRPVPEVIRELERAIAVGRQGGPPQ